MINKELEKTIESIIHEAKAQKHEYLCVEHLLYAILHDNRGVDIITACGGNVSRLNSQIKDFFKENVPKLVKTNDSYPQLTIGFQRVLQRAILHIQAAGRVEADAGDVLAALLNEEESHAVFFLKKEGITRLDILNYISHGIPGAGNESGATDEEPSGRGKKQAPAGDPLKSFTVDLTDKAKQGDIDPLIGREGELERAIQILSRRRKNNPLFVGEPGVGKTAIVEGLALKIFEKDVPELLEGSRIFMLDMGSVLAGTKYRGDFEARLKSTIDKLKRIPKAMLFIDEIHTVVGAGATSGGSMDASNILKPVLASGKLRCIGSSTYDEYRQHFQKDRALSRRFQKIDVEEPTINETYRILKGLKSYYEEFHGVKFSPKSLLTAAELSARHINDKFLPDKAIDVIDEAAALLKLSPSFKRKKTVTPVEIESIVSKTANIPARSVSTSESDKLQNLAFELKQKVFGQDSAIDALTTSIKRSRAGLSSPDKPIGSFLFAGPTGVGKTEISKQLAEILGIKFIRFDMSEYMEKHAVARLIGAPPGYIGFDQGGLLTEEIRKNPYSLLLLDEIEKAHEDIFDILLQVMDHATLTDNNGKKADFRNTILIMTSNAGAREMDKNAIGFGERDDDGMSESDHAIKKHFSPEFRNRLDEIITFKRLTTDIMEKIVLKFIDELGIQLSEKKVEIDLSDKAVKRLAVKGYDHKFGARPMSRVIQKEIKDILSDEILFGQLKNGGKVYIDVKDDSFAFTYSEIRFNRAIEDKTANRPLLPL